MSLKDVINAADAVCFDVDSTVSATEGIDELAKFLGKHEEISKMTEKAMSGSMTFRNSLKQRMNILSPHRSQIEQFIAKEKPRLSKNIKNFIESLLAQSKMVFLVSGGFRCIIEPIADALKIPRDHIYANKMMFYYSGEYAGFDESQPTSENGGKPKVVQLLKEKYSMKNVILIGDGITDLEASPPADSFIGYGGNVIREAVREKSKYFIHDFQELM